MHPKAFITNNTVHRSIEPDRSDCDVKQSKITNLHINFMYEFLLLPFQIIVHLRMHIC